MPASRIDPRRPTRATRPLALGTALAAALALALPGAAGAQGKDDMWEITSKMEMPGMPPGMSMPAQVTRQCVAKGASDDAYVPRRDNCKVLESRRAGNKVAYKMACTGKDAMTVSGETTMGSNSYEGRMQMMGKMEGQDMQLTQTYSGKRVGDCTAAK